MGTVWRLGAIAVLAIAIFMQGSVATAAVSKAETAAVDTRPIPDRVLVRFKSNASAADRAATMRAAGAKLEQRLLIDDVAVLKLDAAVSISEALDALEASASVVRAGSTHNSQLAALPNDTDFSKLWGLHNTGQTVNGVAGTPDADIDAPEAWDVTKGDADVTVAVVDTGVAYDHPDLAPNVWTNAGEAGKGKETNGVDDDHNGVIDDWRGFPGGADPIDVPLVHVSGLLYHGTHVAGTIAARGNNGLGVSGVSWKSKIMPVVVCGAIVGLCSNTAIINGFAYAGANGADVVNASLGGGSWSLAEQKELRNAVLAAPDTLFVVAAGNLAANNDAGAYLPCTLAAPNLICVAASNQNDQLAAFSNFGRNTVGLAAPGESVYSTQRARQELLQEGFESAVNPPVGPGWVTGGTNNSWARSGELKSSGSFGLSDSPGGNYQNNTNSFARKTVPVSPARRWCEVTVNALLEVGQGDSGYMEYSIDGKPWQPATSDPIDDAEPFLKYRMFLGDPSQSLGFGFHLVSDASGVAGGVYADELELACEGIGSAAYDGKDYRFLEGTSMAAPQVSGVAALLKSKYPNATGAAMRGALISGADAKPSLAGKTISGGRLNAAKALERMKQTYVDVLQGTMYVSDPTGTSNVLAVAKTGNAYTVRDTKAKVFAGAGCVPYPGDAKRVDCSGVSRIVVSANAGNDSVTLNGSVDVPATLAGGAGNDVLVGGSAGDTLDGGSGADNLTGGGGIDLVDYTARTAAVTVDLAVPTGAGEAGENDSVSGIEAVFGGAGNDVLGGGGANDILLGGAGNNILIGNGGADILLGGFEADVIIGGPGNDLALGAEGNDVFVDGILVWGFAEGGNDDFRGDAGDDSINAGVGADALYGGEGADTLEARDGAAGDALNCGNGTDRFGRDAGDTAVECETLLP